MKILMRLMLLGLLLASLQAFSAETNDADPAATICNDELEVSAESDGEESDEGGDAATVQQN